VIALAGTELTSQAGTARKRSVQIDFRALRTLDRYSGSLDRIASGERIVISR
jgi:hypothetical protein